MIHHLKLTKTQTITCSWIKKHSKGSIEILPDDSISSRDGLTLEMGSIEPDSYRMSVDLMMGEGGEAAVFFPGISLRVSIDPGDHGTARLVQSKCEGEKHLEFKTTPDLERWSNDPGDLTRFRQEFDGSPEWTGRWMRLGYDIRGSTIQFRFQGRFIGEHTIEPRGAPSIHLPGGAVIRNLSVTSLDDLGTCFHPLEISPYFNNSDGNEDPGRGLTTCGGVPFLLDSRGEDLDLSLIHI